MMQQGIFCNGSERGECSTEANSVLSDELDCCCSASSIGDDVPASDPLKSDVSPDASPKLLALRQEVSDGALALHCVVLETKAVVMALQAVQLEEIRQDVSDRAWALRSSKQTLREDVSKRALREEVDRRAVALRNGEAQACTLQLLEMRQELQRRALSLRMPVVEKRARDELQLVVAEVAQLDLQAACASELKDMRLRLSDGLAHARRLSLAGGVVREVELYRRRVNFEIQDRKGQLRVCCRVRPMNKAELALGDAGDFVSPVGDTSVKVSGVGTFEFDHVFAPGSQAEMFEDCQDLIEAAFDGRNATIFAYGQTGSGKTHTMYGSPRSEGVAPRTIDHLFGIIEERSGSSCTTVLASMVDVYNNRLVDLLAPDRRFNSSRPRLAVRLAAEGDVRVDGLSERVVASAAELRALFASGLSRRVVAPGIMNAVSSRSHLLFTIKVVHASPQTGETLNGKIVLCDLGGREQLKHEDPGRPLSGDRRQETIELNKALSALGNVFEAVAKKQEQVPYRDHLLTRLMQDSIGGTAKTLMFLNCSPALANVRQTVCVLRFGEKARTVVNKVKKAPSVVNWSRLGA